LAAVPPLAGFSGKWFILVQAIRGADLLVYAGIVVLLLNSLLSLGYYLPLIATLFSRPPEGADELARIPVSLWMAVPLLILGGLVIAMGVYPGPWLDGMTAVGVRVLSFAR
jgi:NADH:ubiquinone oxidoreductase subunit 2 (subunit N)